MSKLNPLFTSNLRGIVLMLIAGLLMTIMAALVRIVSQDMHPFQVAFCRNAIGILLFMPLFVRTGLKHLKTRRLGSMLSRGVFNAIAMLTYFISLTLLPLAEVSALTFTVPLFVCLLAVCILREKIGLRRVTCLIVGFFGALIIIRPGIEIIDVGAIYALISAVAWAIAVVIIKSLSRTESTITITFYGLVFLTIFTFIPAWIVWEWPTKEQYYWLILMAVIGTLGQLAFTQSLKSADATLVIPFDFSKLIWASIFGYFLFMEIPSVWTLFGGVVIFSSATYLTYREGRDSKSSNAIPREAIS